VGMLVGVFVATQLNYWRLNFDLPWLTFGRLRPLHTNAVIFAFAGNAFFMGCYYSTQRLLKARMFSDGLSRFHFWGWQAIIVSAALTLPLGFTQAKEYAELEWPIDIAIAVVWVIFAVNFFGTLIRRRERHIYVALWFYIASIVTVAILHIFNNLSVPAGLFKSYSIYAGVQDAFMQWWYGHNAVAFFLTTPFLGLMYYFMPKAAEGPVFSYKLSILHFWSLVFMYIWAGPHHLHYTALPEWASTVGMLFSVMLWAPSWGGMINGLLTLRGAWDKVAADPILKFFVVGITFYGMSTFEGPMLSIKSINALSHYTDWTIAHVHSGALGWNGFMTFGMLYWLAPRLFQTKGVWNQKWVSAHFWLGTIGIVLYVLPIYAAGITQGLMWRAFDETGRLQFPAFVDTLVALMPMYWFRLLGGTLFLIGMIMCFINVVMTWAARPAVYEEPEHAAPALERGYVDAPVPASHLTSNIEWGRNVESKIIQGWFHRIWERKPLKFTIMTTLAVIIASLFEIIPTFLIRSNVPTIASVTPYTPLELIGREIYIAEGCYNCHSQMIRPMWAETKRYGEYSKAGEFVYDHPFQWGSRRIGPDLAREGGRQSHDWHVRHLANPRELMPQSIMPGYSHLLRRDLDFGAIQSRVDGMAMLGVPYGDVVKNKNAGDLAKAQAKTIAQDLIKQGGFEFYFPGGGDGAGLSAQEREAYRVENKQVLALVAYLQRLGTDISKVVPVAPAAEPANAAAPTAESSKQPASSH
ncbi:MAG: cytochrome-c oxidase, cbb3-type subunit I, partial [Planctomycetota bacterium]|nr:cytochrome-c oxidase, cbb3-type subunit I [Planctomycetota bacterium]